MNSKNNLTCYQLKRFISIFQLLPFTKMSFNIPHSCQTYWWTTSEFFKTLISSLEGKYQPVYQSQIEDNNKLIESFSLLSIEEQTSLIEIIKNLSSIANELGNIWVHPHNRDNDPILATSIQTYNQLEKTFYNLNRSFVNERNFSGFLEVVTRILHHNVSMGERFYTNFLSIFRIE